MSSVGPKLLVTGFGPFPGAPRNPTAALIESFVMESPEAFGAGALKAVVLPTEYRCSWQKLRRLYALFRPDVVVHFGLHQTAAAIHVETVGRIALYADKPDAAGHVPALARARRAGPAQIATTFPAPAIVSALAEAGFPAALSDDAGAYVCNATLYRSLAANAAPSVGFIHVPPLKRGCWTAAQLREAAGVVLRTATANRTGARRSRRAAQPAHPEMPRA